MKRRRFMITAGAGAALAFGPRSLFAQTAAAQKITLVQAGPPLAFTGILLATRQKLWEAEGLEITSKNVMGGPLALTALTAGEAQFSTLASADVVIATDKQIPIISVAAVTTSLSLAIVARTDWMAAKGVSAMSPLDARVKALKGARIGVATVGGGPAQYGRYLLHAHGLDPQRDAQFLPVGQAATRIAALRENRVDIIIAAPPEPEIIEPQGFGALYVNLTTDVPIFREYAFTILITTRDLAAKNPDLVRRAARAVGRGNAIVHTDFATAVKTAQEAHPSVNPAAVELAMTRYKPGYPRDARMNHTMWRNVVESLRATGAIARDISADEGGMWTNQYLG